MTDIGHDHNLYLGRVSVVLATYRAGQRLAFDGFLSTGDLHRHRQDALRTLAEMARPAKPHGTRGRH